VSAGPHDIFLTQVNTQELQLIISKFQNVSLFCLLLCLVSLHQQPAPGNLIFRPLE